jgi:hypothetical protein
MADLDRDALLHATDVSVQLGACGPAPHGCSSVMTLPARARLVMEHFAKQPASVRKCSALSIGYLKPRASAVLLSGQRSRVAARKLQPAHPGLRAAACIL